MSTLPDARSAHGTMRRSWSIFGVAMLISAALVACGPDPKPLVGDLLSSVVNSITTTIDNAAATGSAALIAAMDEAEAAAYNVVNELSTDLGKHIDQVNSDVQSDIQLLQNLATEVSAGVSAIISEITANTQQVLNELPLINKNPQVTRYSPHYTVPGATVTLDATGNFVNAYQKGQHPTLAYGGSSYTASVLTSQEIGFTLPASVFANSTNQIESLSFPVNVAYETGVVFKSLKPGQFVLRVLLLPAMPTQSISLTVQQTTTGVATEDKTSPVGATTGGPLFSENSFDCRTHDMTESISPDPNYTISAAHAIISSVKNAYNVHLLNSTVTPVGAVFEYQTAPNCFLGICNGCGEVYWYIAYQEQTPTTTTKPVSSSIVLSWGSNESFPVTPGWSVNAALFNGAILNCTDTCQDANGYVQITNHNNTTISIVSTVPTQ